MHPAVCGVCVTDDVCRMLWTVQSGWHKCICVAVVDDIAGDDATAGPSDGATAGNDAGSHW